MRALNAAAGLQTYTIATFASSVEKQLTGHFKSQLVFKSVGNNDMYDTDYNHLCATLLYI